MKNLLLIFSFLLFLVNCYTQQFTFNELLLMTNDYKVFELNMIKKITDRSNKKIQLFFHMKQLMETLGLVLIYRQMIKNTRRNINLTMVRFIQNQK